MPTTGSVKSSVDRIACKISVDGICLLSVCWSDLNYAKIQLIIVEVSI